MPHSDLRREEAAVIAAKPALPLLVDDTDCGSWYGCLGVSVSDEMSDAMGSKLFPTEQSDRHIQCIRPLVSTGFIQFDVRVGVLSLDYL